MHGVDRAATRVRGDRRVQSGVRDTKPDFLAFHIAARLTGGRRGLYAELGQQRITRLLKAVTDEDADQEHDRERCKNGPALPRVADHLVRRCRSALRE